MVKYPRVSNIRIIPHEHVRRIPFNRAGPSSGLRAVLKPGVVIEVMRRDAILCPWIRDIAVLYHLDFQVSGGVEVAAVDVDDTGASLGIVGVRHPELAGDWWRLRRAEACRAADGGAAAAGAVTENEGWETAVWIWVWEDCGWLVWEGDTLRGGKIMSYGDVLMPVGR